MFFPNPGFFTSLSSCCWLSFSWRQVNLVFSLAGFEGFNLCFRFQILELKKRPRATHLTPILQSITQGESNSASRSSIWLYRSPSFTMSPW